METSKILITESSADYELLDSGEGEKLERFGRFTLSRPDPQALWPKRFPADEWKKADACFGKEAGSAEKGDRGGWMFKNEGLPPKWPIDFAGLKFWIKPTAFKHVGLFPEQSSNWRWLKEIISGALGAAASSGTAELASRDRTALQSLGRSRIAPVDQAISARSNSPRLVGSSALPASTAGAAQTKQAVPATHKPFADLNKVLPVKTPASARTPASSSVPDSIPAVQAPPIAMPVPAARSAPLTPPQPVATPAAPAKPVGLSSLAPKPAPRFDPKVPTQKNMNDLRSALAAALGNTSKPPVAPKVPTIEIRPAGAVPTPPVPISPAIRSAVPSSPPAPASQSASPKPPQAFQPAKPDEVPEDVLKKVLKGE